MLGFLWSLLWKVVFWWKKRTGFIDMKETIEVVGTVLSAHSSEDGDRTFDVRLDPEYNRYITGFGGRLTQDVGATEPSLHCEVVPWNSDEVKATFDSLAVGDRVRVKGEWGFDGVHVGTNMVFEVILALVRHQPNVHDGWFEIHPVTELEKL